MIELLLSASVAAVAAAVGFSAKIFADEVIDAARARKALSDFNLMMLAALEKFDGIARRRTAVDLRSVTIAEYSDDRFVRERVDALISLQKRDDIGQSGDPLRDGLRVDLLSDDPSRSTVFLTLMKSVEFLGVAHVAIYLRNDIEQHFRAIGEYDSTFRFLYTMKERQKYIWIVGGQVAAQKFIELNISLNAIVHRPDVSGVSYGYNIIQLAADFYSQMNWIPDVYVTDTQKKTKDVVSRILRQIDEWGLLTRVVATLIREIGFLFTHTRR